MGAGACAADLRQHVAGTVHDPGPHADGRRRRWAPDAVLGEAASAEWRWRKRRCGDGKREEKV